MGWSVDDLMPGRDGPENLRILKIESVEKLRLDHGGGKLTSCGWRIELDLGRWRCSWGFRISTNRDLKHHKMLRTLGMVSIIIIVSLSSCRYGPKSRN